MIRMISSKEFIQLVEKITPYLWSSAYSMTKDKEKANDLVQEALLKGYTHRRSFKAGTNFRAWLYRIMYNTFASHHKREKRICGFNERYVSGYDKSYEKMDHTDLGEVYKAIHKLSKVYREPFMMHFKGFKYKEIARCLAIPIGTVKNRIHLAKKQLQYLLRPYCLNYSS